MKKQIKPLPKILTVHEEEQLAQCEIADAMIAARKAARTIHALTSIDGGIKDGGQKRNQKRGQRNE